MQLRFGGEPRFAGERVDRDDVAGHPDTLLTATCPWELSTATFRGRVAAPSSGYWRVPRPYSGPGWCPRGGRRRRSRCAGARRRRRWRGTAAVARWWRSSRRPPARPRPVRGGRCRCVLLLRCRSTSWGRRGRFLRCRAGRLLPTASEVDLQRECSAHVGVELHGERQQRGDLLHACVDGVNGGLGFGHEDAPAVSRVG